MSEGLPDLVSHVKLETTGVETGVAKTRAELGGLGGATQGLESQFKGLLSSVTGGAGSFGGFASAGKSALAGVSGEGNTLKSVLTGVGVGAAGVGVALAGMALEGISKFTSAAGEVRKLQATLGSTAEDASKLRNVAIGLGVDVDTMGKALFKLGPILEKNKGDLGGVNVEIGHNADGSTNLVKTLDNMRVAYQSITDPVQKSQFALDAFKKTGLELRPILSATNEQFKALANHGPIFNQDDLNKAKELSIAQRELKQSIDNVEIALAKNLVPTITSFVTDLTSVVGAAQKVGTAVGGLVDHLGPLKSVLIDSINPITRTKDLLHLLHLSHDSAKGSAEAHKQAEQDVADKMQEATKQADAEAKALDKLATAQEKNVDAGIALERAKDSVAKAADNETRAQQALNKEEINADGLSGKLKAARDALAAATRQYGAESNQAAAARLNLAKVEEAGGEETDKLNMLLDAQDAASQGTTDAMVALAKATRDKKVADEEANGKTVTAVEKTALFKQALLDEAATLAPGTPLRTQLEAYANQIHDIPDSKALHVSADTSAASSNISNLKSQLDALNDAAAHPNASASPGGDYMGGVISRHAIGGVTKAASGLGVLAPGGGRPHGPTLVSEAGFDEWVITPDPSYRRRNVGLLSQANQALGSPLGGGHASVAIDYERLAAAVATAVAANPIAAVVSSNDVSAAIYASAAGRR